MQGDDPPARLASMHVRERVLRRAAHTPAPQARPRAAELDWLRLGAVVLVLVVHSAQVFSPLESWHIASPDGSRGLALFTAFTAPWIMSLFTLLAGAAAWFSMRRMPPHTFVRTRVLRLLPPLVLGTLILVPPQLYYRRIYRGEFEGSFLQFYPRFFDGVFPDGNFSYGHLWFIAYLIVYFVAALPIFHFLRRPAGRALLALLGRACERRAAILWGALPLAIGQLLLRAHYTQTTGALIDDWATHAWLFTALLSGYAFYAEPRLLAAVDRDWRIAIGPAVLAWAVLALFVLPGDAYARLPAEPGWWYVCFWTVISIASWSWMLVILGAGRRFLGRSSRFLERWRRSAYGIYVLHQTVVVWVAFHVVDWPLGVHARFLLVAMLSLAGTLGLIAALRRAPGVRTAFGVA
jgi:glucans biosynthesis protein C